MFLSIIFHIVMKNFVPNKEPIKLSDGSMIVNGELVHPKHESGKRYFTIDECEMHLLNMLKVIDEKLIKDVDD